MGVVLFLSEISAQESSADASPRIVFGKPARIENWPAIVSVIERAEESSFPGHICGGSMILPGWVLSAGHCINGLEIDVTVHRKNIATTKGSRYAVARIYRHPGYQENRGVPIYDFALLQLARFPKQAKTYRLANTNHLPRFFKTAGWGDTGASPRSPRSPIEEYPMGPSPELREVVLLARSDNTCKRLYKGVYVPGAMVCVGGVKGKDICFGDSGGPLIFKGTLFGVASFGKSCTGAPSVFAEVSAARGWIKKVIKESPPAPDLYPGIDMSYEGYQ